MPRRAPDGRVPDWNALFELAGAQCGYFTAKQAAGAGYSLQLLQYYLRAGELDRWARGIFRLKKYPSTDFEELAVAFLWSGGVGVFGLTTALALYNLSDVLPSKQHLFLPTSWSKRRLRAPSGVLLTFSDVPEEDRTWMGPALATTPFRTISDCIARHVAPQFVEQAIFEGQQRGMLLRDEVRRLRRQLRVSSS